MTYNFHTINHIEFTDRKKQKLLFKFEGIPIFNERKYQVDLYERTFRYCDYSYKYLVIKSNYPKEESNQNVNKCMEKPVSYPFSKSFTNKINKKLKSVLEIENSETDYIKDEGICLIDKGDCLVDEGNCLLPYPYSVDEGDCIVDLEHKSIKVSSNHNEKNEIDEKLSEPKSQIIKNDFEEKSDCELKQKLILEQKFDNQFEKRMIFKNLVDMLNKEQNNRQFKNIYEDNNKNFFKDIIDVYEMFKHKNQNSTDKVTNNNTLINTKKKFTTYKKSFIDGNNYENISEFEIILQEKHDMINNT